VILIAVSSADERSALAALSASRGWITSEHADLHSSRRAMERAAPRVIITRLKLIDGFSDDLLRHVRQGPETRRIRALVLAPASLTPEAEARQVLLGADCVLRDPIRSEVLCAYLERFLTSSRSPASRAHTTGHRLLNFAGATLDPSERMLTFRRKSIRLTPREASLCEALVRNRSQLVSYENLFLDVLDRKFSGDTSNLRVLLAKLAHSFARLGFDLRRWIEVIPKAGQKLLAHPRPSPQPARRIRSRSFR
jgi:DNA-binding response OmpR family regulator